MIDRQQLFATAVAGIRAQGTYSGNDDIACMYRGPNGTKCAIGHMIPDERYHRKLEGCFADSSIVLKAAGLTEPDYEDTSFLREMQTRLHDDIVTNQIERHAETAAADFMRVFETRVVQFAAEYQLEVPQ